MPQYLPYIPEVFPNPVIYNPDFNFFDTVLKRKQSQFEQGLLKTKSAYSSVANAPLSDSANIIIRDQYIKQAEDKLKQISTTDLSNPQNVEIAENIFSPFWEDALLYKDAQLTQFYQEQFRKLSDWKNSTDKNERSQYNGIVETWVTNGLMKLQNANRNPDNYKTLERREAIPFINLEEYVNTQLKTNYGAEIKYDDPSGPYLVNSINGERSKLKYAAIIESILGNNFYDQFRITGITEKEERAKKIKRDNPLLSDSEIGDVIANDVVDELKKGYKTRIEKIDDEISNIDNSLKSIKESNNPNNIAIFQKLIDERASLIAAKENIKREYDNFDDKKDDQLFNIVKDNPDQYFTTLAKQRFIDNMSTARASFESKTVNANVAWKNAEDINIQKKQNELRERELILAENKFNAGLDKESSGDGSGSGKSTRSSKETPTVVGQDKQSSLLYRGFSGMDVRESVPTAYDHYNSIQKQNFQESFGLIFDQRGVLSFAKNLGLSDEELAHIATAFQKEIASDYEYKFTKEQNEASNKLAKALLSTEAVKNAGITRITGPHEARNALLAYAQDYFVQRNKLISEGADVPYTQDEFEMLIRYTTAVQKLDEYMQNEKKSQELIEKNILPDKTFEKLIVTDGKKKRLVTIKDIAKDMPSLKLQDKNGTILNLSNEDVARMYVTGKFEYLPTYNENNPYSTAKINGNSYDIVMITDSKGHAVIDHAEFRRIQNKYGTSEEFSKLYNAANNKIVPDLLMYRNKSGQQGTLWTLYFMPNKTMGEGDKAAAILDQALNMANSDIYNEDLKPTDSETMSSIRALLKSEKNMEEYIAAEYIPQGVGGKRTIRITFTKPINENEKSKIGSTSLSSLTGKSFNIVIKDGATTPALDNLPYNAGYQIYNDITRGKMVRSDKIMEAAGFSFTIIPNVLASEGGVDESPSYVDVNLKYNVRMNYIDQETGQLTTKLTPVENKFRFDLIGEKAKSPDEIVNEIYTKYYQNMLENKQRWDDYQKTVPKGSYDEMLREAGLTHLIK